MQFDPLSTWERGRVVPWQERQFMSGVCQAGWTGPRAWLGVAAWQVEQPDASRGNWHVTQWVLLVPPKSAVWLRGKTSWWHRSQLVDS